MLKIFLFFLFCFSCEGRAPPRNNIVDLNSGNIDVPPNMTSWASFHNGVAAGLKIAPASQVCINILHLWSGLFASQNISYMASQQ